jgi:hypothetical protein
MNEGENPHEAPRPVPVPDAVRDLIRHIAAERPAPTPSLPERTFRCDGEEWTVRIAGELAVGSAISAALLVQLLFYPAGAERPLRETFITQGRFEMLYDEELCALLHAARPVPPAE